MRRSMPPMGARLLEGYGAEIVVPREIRAEIAVLKGIVAAYVMQSDRRQPVYRQRGAAHRAADTLWEAGPVNSSYLYAADSQGGGGRRSGCTARRGRSGRPLTDQSAIAWYERRTAQLAERNALLRTMRCRYRGSSFEKERIAFLHESRCRHCGSSCEK